MGDSVHPPAAISTQYHISGRMQILNSKYSWGGNLRDRKGFEAGKLGGII
jgi:hypothetical protein